MNKFFIGWGMGGMVMFFLIIFLVSFYSCEHKWKETARTYAQPRTDIDDMRCSMRTMEKIMHGVTTILWECEKCHKIRKEEMLGKEKS